jgi:hypothetical protein
MAAPTRTPVTTTTRTTQTCGFAAFRRTSDRPSITIFLTLRENLPPRDSKPDWIAVTTNCGLFPVVHLLQAAMASVSRIHLSYGHFIVVPAFAGDDRRLIFRRPGQAKREPGSIRRAAGFERRCPTTFAQRSRPVVMGPCVRRDDDRKFWHTLTSPRRLAPGLSIDPSPEEGAGNAGCHAHPQPRTQNEKRTSVVTAGPRRLHPAFPHANGFNGFLRARPGDRALLSPSSARLPKHPCRFDISVGISGPHDFAVRFKRTRLLRQKRPSHPAPNVRDDRETPLIVGAGRRRLWI